MTLLKLNEQRKQPTNERTRAVAWGAKRFVTAQVPRAISWAYNKAGAILMPVWWLERSAQSHSSFYWHMEEISHICPKVHLPKTRTTIPSSAPFILPALILVNPSLMILFLLPFANFHLPPVPHPMGNPTAFVFFGVFKCTSTSPLALLLLLLQILPLETQSPHWLSQPTSFHLLHKPAHLFERVLFSFSRRF